MIVMHQDFIRGKKLLLIFNNGHQEFGKFRKSERGVLYFFDRDPVKMNKIKSASYYKPIHESLLSKGDN